MQPLLNSIKEFTPCNHGNGWKLQKFHKIMHLPMDIYMYGSPQNYDNSPTEHGLIETAKHPADHAQKSWSLFVSQVTKRLMETVLIKKTKQSLQHSHEIDMVEKSVNDFSNLPISASFCITFKDNGTCVPRWLGKNIFRKVLFWILICSPGFNHQRGIKSLFYEVDEF